MMDFWALHFKTLQVLSGDDPSPVRDLGIVGANIK